MSTSVSMTRARASSTSETTIAYGRARRCSGGTAHSSAAAARGTTMSTVSHGAIASTPFISRPPSPRHARGEDDDEGENDAAEHHGGVGPDVPGLRPAQARAEPGGGPGDPADESVDDGAVSEDHGAGEVLRGPHEQALVDRVLVEVLPGRAGQR